MSISRKLLDRIDESSVKFTKITRQQFETIATSNNSEESQIDGKQVTVVYNGKNCIAVFYEKANIGSSAPKFKGDLIAYSESDPNYPY